MRLTDLGFRIPKVLEPARETVTRVVESLERAQKELADMFDLDAAGMNFDVKKQITSAMRRIAPIGLATTLVWTANCRTLRHIIPLRTAAHAEEEMQLVFGEVAEMMVAEAPMLFGDLVKNDRGEWISGDQ